jgi:hypothetical protein
MTMDIIFAELPPYAYWVGRLLRKLNHNVYYIKLSASPSRETQTKRASKLRDIGILPLPFDSLPKLTKTGASNYDAEKRALKKSETILNKKLLKSISCLYKNVDDVVDKLQLIQRWGVSISTVGNMNTWANANPDRKHLLIYFSLKGFLHPELVANASALTVPLDFLIKPFTRLGSHLSQNLGKIFFRPKEKQSTYKSEVLSELRSTSKREPSVAYIVHCGLKYGNLFNKELYYSDCRNSALHQENILHIDYSGVQSPSTALQWFCLHSLPHNLLKQAACFLKSMLLGIAHVRTLNQLISLVLLSRTYVRYQFYLQALSRYNHLKVALIDYDALCPKALLFALETKKIRTVATQERMIGSFYNTIFYIFYDYYFCASEFVEKVMRKSSIYSVKRYIPVGQYRSDYLLPSDKKPPHELEKALESGKKIITALGYHTPLHWYESEYDPMLSWKAQRHFLEDMLQLSKDLRDVFILLRFKMIDWAEISVFSSVLEEINQSGNISISCDYSESHMSYKLCCFADLVIAKHTSLGDECLSVGIPVLFHEYTHNTVRLMADAFDYAPTDVMCFNYGELHERVIKVLEGDHQMMQSYQYLKEKVYGDFADGYVKQRIHRYLESLLRSDGVSQDTAFDLVEKRESLEVSQ